MGAAFTDLLADYAAAIEADYRNHGHYAVHLDMEFVFVPLVFTLNKPELRTLAVGMFSFAGEHTIDWSGMAAGASISLVRSSSYLLHSKSIS